MLLDILHGKSPIVLRDPDRLTLCPFKSFFLSFFINIFNILSLFDLPPFEQELHISDQWEVLHKLFLSYQPKLEVG
jgi:hypothetical protein